MSCKCKNIIENFQGGTIPLTTTFNGDIHVCGDILGCSPVTIGNDSGCTSGNTTLVVSGSSIFSCDVDIVGNIYSGGTNLLDIFSTTTSSGSTGGGGTFTGNTSATCINELWVSNISGCSPVTIGTEAEFSQDVSVSQYIRHTGDADTHIQFLDNKLQLHAGNIPFIQLDKDAATPYPLTINHGGNRVNLRVLDKDSNLLLKTDSEASKVNLYHAGSMKLETQIGGIDVIGELNVTSGLTVTGDTIVKGGKILLGDGDVSNNYAGFGNNDDLKIFHNGAHSIIRETGTGNLYLQSDNNVILSKDNSTEPMVKGIADGAVELYYDNIKKFETTTDGAKVSGELNVTSGLTVTSSGTNTSDTVFLVQDSVGNHIIEGLDTGQVHVGDLVNSALPTNPTLLIGAGKTPNDRGSLAFTSSGIGIGGDNDTIGDYLHFLLPGSDNSRWKFDTSSAFGFTLVSRQNNTFGSGSGTRSSFYTSRTYGVDFLLGYASSLGVTDTVGYRFNTKDSTSAGANDIERFVIENGAAETKSYFDNISVLGIGTYNPDTNVKVHISGDTLMSGSFTASTMTLSNVPAFADDSAAGTGGLSVGDVYQTSGTGAAPLNVAGILMIKQ